MDAVAPTTDGKNSSARHVPKSLTSVIGVVRRRACTLSLVLSHIKERDGE
jgi:hypothetical protein